MSTKRPRYTPLAIANYANDLITVHPNIKPKFIDAGGFNEAWTVTKSNGEEIVARISRKREDSDELREELKMYKEMSRLKIGLEFYGGKVYEESMPGEGILFMLMEKADVTLDQFLDGHPDSQHLQNATSMQALARSLVKAIEESSNSHYMCGDMKPGNVLIKGNKAYLSDFDPGYCVRDGWVQPLCKMLKVRRCVIQYQSKATVRALYTRMMIFALYKQIIPYATTLNAHYFAGMLRRYGMESTKQDYEPIQLGDRTVTIHDVVDLLLGPYAKQTFYNQMQHYVGKHTGINPLNNKNYKRFVENLPGANFPAVYGTRTSRFQHIVGGSFAIGPKVSPPVRARKTIPKPPAGKTMQQHGKNLLAQMAKKRSAVRRVGVKVLGAIRIAQRKKSTSSASFPKQRSVENLAKGLGARRMSQYFPIPKASVRISGSKSTAKKPRPQNSMKLYRKK